MFNSRAGHATTCRDNVTMISGHKVVGYCIITITVVATLFRHPDLKFLFIFFLSRKLYYVVALSLSRRYKIVACPHKFCVSCRRCGEPAGVSEQRRAAGPGGGQARPPHGQAGHRQHLGQEAGDGRRTVLTCGKYSKKS